MRLVVDLSDVSEPETEGLPMGFRKHRLSRLLGMRKVENAQLHTILGPRPDSVRLARELIRSLYAKTFMTADADTALLLVSELVSNAIQHARSTIRLTATASADRLRVEVTDASDRLPLAHRYSPDAITGRGLHLLDLLADSWGFDVYGPNGKRVWFELGTERAP